MYAPVVGSPMPRINDTSMIRHNARNGISRANEKTNPTNLNPKPVRLTAPTTIPAHAHAMQTIGIFFAPRWMASMISFGPILCPGWTSDTIQARNIPMTAAYIGV